ncbi:MAG: GNAT family N-acetyltransferase [Halobacteriovoraceae bacterium]|nr:GNAT family N-acetyltransferase [Halobacteriovoraceae bacterium]
MEFISLTRAELPAVKAFTDQWIGKDYYEISELEGLYDASLIEDSGATESCSYLALCDGELAGVRLSFAPGKWEGLITRGLTPTVWGVDFSQMAYFKSLFVAEKFQGKGIGISLSQKSLETLKKGGAKGVLCHSWLESPGNSSQRYLKKFGFEEVKKHPKFWFPIDYECTRCAPERCVCTASEMILRLEE